TKAPKSKSHSKVSKRASSPNCVSTGCKCKYEYTQKKPEQGEYQSIPEELPKVYSCNAGNNDVPKGRNQVTHVIPNTHRQQSTLDSSACSHRRRRSYVTLNHPLPTARRNEYRHDRSGNGSNKRK